MIRFVSALVLSLLLAAAASAETTYQIRPGDVLRIEVLEDPDLNRNTIVLPDGSISFPLAGSLRVAGTTTDQVSGALAGQLAANFAIAPTVHVSVATLAERPARVPVEPDLINVYIVGEVANPGRREVARGTTLLQFLAEAGGLTRFAADRRIQLRRAGPDAGEQVYPFNYRDMGGQGSISPATMLAPGDVIVVPERRLFE